MSKLDIIHLVPYLIPYGAYSSMSELHYAFDKYHSDEVTQHVLSLKSSSEKGMFDLPYQAVSIGNLRKTIQDSMNNPVVIMHKLSATICTDVSRAIYGRIPLLIVNHTQSNKTIGLAPSNGVIAVSNYMQDSLSKVFKKFEIHHIRNGVNACRFDEIGPISPKQVEKYFISGRMNNFNNCKHTKDWIPWIAQTKLRRRHWHDYIGGGMNLKRAQEQYKRSNRGKNVIYMPGRINDFKTKASYVRRWDVFLYEIRGNEGTSMALLEALACGVPAIINNKPGNNEVIQKGINGYVCKKRNDMVNKLNFLSSDEEALKQLSDSTRRHFDKHLDAKHMAMSYLELAKTVSAR